MYRSSMCKFLMWRNKTENRDGGVTWDDGRLSEEVLFDNSDIFYLAKLAKGL